MSFDESINQKALRINLDDSLYGTFAEIGAGQEVARHFFQAGRASHTVAKTISAYDMTFSDAIYGKDERYVCQARIEKMLDHEFGLLEERLAKTRGASTRFFAFADTVATGSHARGEARSHGWLGVRFQTEPLGPTSELIVHVRLWDQFRLSQQESLGRVGVNLIHAAFYRRASTQELASALLDHVGSERVEIDLIQINGPAFAHLDQRLLNLELVVQGHTEAVLFDPKGEVQLLSELIFGKSCLVLRGSFRPLTNTNKLLLDQGLAEFKKQSSSEVQPLLEMTMNSLTAEGELDQQDFLDRVDMMSSLGLPVLVSKFFLFYQLKSYLRNGTKEKIALVIGASHLEKLFDEKYYKELRGGILEAFSRTFDSQSQLLVFPFKTQNQCVTAASWRPQKELSHLYLYLLENGFICDISGCDDIDTSIHSDQVRQMLLAGSDDWQQLVPESVRATIIAKKLFGYNRN